MIDIDIRDLSCYVKLPAKWAKETAKGLLAVCKKGDLIDLVLLGREEFAFRIMNLPSTFSRSAKVNAIGNCDQFCVSAVAESLLGILSKITAASKDDTVGMRITLQQLNVTMFGKDKRSDINYQFPIYDRNGDWGRIATCCSIEIDAWALIDISKRIKRIKDSGGLAGISGFEVGTFDGNLVAYAYNHHMSIRAVVKGRKFVKGGHCGLVCLDLGSAHDIGGACAGMGDEDRVIIGLGSGMTITSDWIDLGIMDKIDKKAGAIERIFNSLDGKIVSKFGINGEKMKGAMDRLSVVAKGSDNIHKVMIWYRENESPGGGRISFQAVGQVVGSGQELVSCEPIEVDPGSVSCVVNASKLDEILKGAGYCADMVIGWGGNMMVVQWNEAREVTEGKGKDKIVRDIGRIEYTAILGLIRNLGPGTLTMNGINVGFLKK